MSKKVEVLTHGQIAANELKERLVELSLAFETNFVDICYTLKDTLEHKAWEHLGYESLGDMTKDLMGFSQRKAYYFAKIAQVADVCGISRERLIECKSTKLSEIFTLDPDVFGKEIADLVDKSNTLTGEEIKKEVKQLQQGESNPTEYITLKLAVEDMEVLKEAIELAKDNYGSTHNEVGDPADISVSKAVSLIAQSYLQDPNNLGEPES